LRLRQASINSKLLPALHSPSALSRSFKLIRYWLRLVLKLVPRWRASLGQKNGIGRSEVGDEPTGSVRFKPPRSWGGICSRPWLASATKTVSSCLRFLVSHLSSLRMFAAVGILAESFSPRVQVSTWTRP